MNVGSSYRMARRGPELRSVKIGIFDINFGPSSQLGTEAGKPTEWSQGTRARWAKEGKGKGSASAAAGAA